MLQRIRDRSSGWIAILILGLISVSFVFFGVNMDFTNAGFIAKVNGTEVSPLEVQRVYQNQAAQLRQQFGGQIPAPIDQQLRQNAMDSVITGTVLRSYLDERGYRVSDANVQESIREIPLFIGADGFSYELYRQELTARGLTPSQFEVDQRDNLRISQLESGIAQTAFVTLSEVRRFIELNNETRTFAYAVFDPVEFRSTDTPSDEAVAAYYDANTEQFQTSEGASIAYVELTRDVVANQVEVTEESLQGYYESVAESFRTPGQRNPRHILIPVDDDESAAESLASSLVTRLESGESFEELAREFSKDGGSSTAGGDLGWVQRGQFVGPVDDAVFTMAEGELRGPIKSEFGWHVIRLDGIREETVTPFAEVRDRVERQYRDEQASQRFIEVSNRLADGLFDNPDLDALAEAQGLEVRKVAEFSRADAALFANNAAATDAVFGENGVRGDALSDVIEIADDRLLILRVDEFRPATLRPLSEVRDSISESILGEQASAAAAVAASAVLDEVAAGVPLAESAANAGAVFTAEQSINRTAADVPATLVTALFAAPPPGVAAPVFDLTAGTGGEPIVFELSLVQPGRPTELSVADRDTERNRLVQDNGRAEFGAFIAELRDNADIEMGTAQVFSNDDNF